MSKNTFNSSLKGVIRKAMCRATQLARGWRTRYRLAWLRVKLGTVRPGSFVRCLDYSILVNDGPNFYILYKDIFINRIYHFEAQRLDPFILDCGSNIGMSLLYFKQIYPRARIIGFEPDPAIFPYLQENGTRNRLTDVQLIQAALSNTQGIQTLYSDGKYGSSLTTNAPHDMPKGWTKHRVRCVRLRDYLTEPVDFLKMNIEGAETAVLADSEDRLRFVQEMVIEYHHLPGLSRTLHELLALLHRQRYEYLINDFDSVTNGEVCPPFHLTPETRYYLLIYARRMD